MDGLGEPIFAAAGLASERMAESFDLEDLQALSPRPPAAVLPLRRSLARGSVTFNDCFLAS